jgi:hypothetical protein
MSDLPQNLKNSVRLHTKIRQYMRTPSAIGAASAHHLRLVLVFCRPRCGSGPPAALLAAQLAARAGGGVSSSSSSSGGGGGCSYGRKWLDMDKELCRDCWTLSTLYNIWSFSLEARNRCTPCAKWDTLSSWSRSTLVDVATRGWCMACCYINDAATSSDTKTLDTAGPSPSPWVLP